jgi:hypothetical protein
MLHHDEKLGANNCVFDDDILGNTATIITVLPDFSVWVTFESGMNEDKNGTQSLRGFANDV